MLSTVSFNPLYNIHLSGSHFPFIFKFFSYYRIDLNYKCLEIRLYLFCCKQGAIYAQKVSKYMRNNMLA